MSSQIILVIGATSAVGREVVRQLTAHGHTVRVLARDFWRAARLHPRITVVRGDLGDPFSLWLAFCGVDKALVLSHAPEIARESNAFTAAAKAQVKHVVLVSAQDVEFPEVAESAPGRLHLESERRLRQSPLAWTILRPSYFDSNVLMPFFCDRRSGLTCLPAGEGREAAIDPRDVAAVSVKVLTSRGHEGKTYTLTGPELLTHAEIMRKVSAVAGRCIRFADESAAVSRERMMVLGFSAQLVDWLIAHFAAARAGRTYVTSTVTELLNRPARTFDEWAHEHAEALGSGNGADDLHPISQYPISPGRQATSYLSSAKTYSCWPSRMTRRRSPS